MPDNNPPTPRQQRYPCSLAEKTGTSFTPPKTKAEASRPGLFPETRRSAHVRQASARVTRVWAPTDASRRLFPRFVPPAGSRVCSAVVGSRDERRPSNGRAGAARRVA